MSRANELRRRAMEISSGLVLDRPQVSSPVSTATIGDQRLTVRSLITLETGERFKIEAYAGASKYWVNEVFLASVGPGGYPFTVTGRADLSLTLIPKSIQPDTFEFITEIGPDSSTFQLFRPVTERRVEYMGLNEIRALAIGDVISMEMFSGQTLRWHGQSMVSSAYDRTGTIYINMDVENSGSRIPFNLTGPRGDILRDTRARTGDGDLVSLEWVYRIRKSNIRGEFPNATTY
jgi:hypothetical protein